MWRKDGKFSRIFYSQVRNPLHAPAVFLPCALYVSGSIGPRVRLHALETIEKIVCYW
jgi:hypothetical protein